MIVTQWSCCTFRLYALGVFVIQLNIYNTVVLLHFPPLCSRRLRDTNDHYTVDLLHFPPLCSRRLPDTTDQSDHNTVVLFHFPPLCSRRLRDTNDRCTVILLLFPPLCSRRLRDTPVIIIQWSCTFDWKVTNLCRPATQQLTGETPSLLLHVHRDRNKLLGTGAQGVHIDFHAAPDGSWFFFFSVG